MSDAAQDPAETPKETEASTDSLRLVPQEPAPTFRIIRVLVASFVLSGLMVAGFLVWKRFGPKKSSLRGSSSSPIYRSRTSLGRLKGKVIPSHGSYYYPYVVQGIASNRSSSWIFETAKVLPFLPKAIRNDSDFLKRHLTNPDWRVVVTMAWGLGEWKHRAVYAIPDLVALLDHSRWQVRVGAIKALHSIREPSEEAAKKLAALMGAPLRGSQDWRVKHAIGWSASFHDPVGKYLLPVYAKVLEKGTHTRALYGAAAGLAQYASIAYKANSFLTKKQLSAAQTAQLQARFQRLALPILIKSIHITPSYVRSRVASALTSVGSLAKQAAPGVLAWLNEERLAPYEYADIAELLSSIGGDVAKKGLPKLVRALPQIKRDDTRQTVLRFLTTKGYADKPTVLALSKSLAATSGLFASQAQHVDAWVSVIESHTPIPALIKAHVIPALAAVFAKAQSAKMKLSILRAFGRLHQVKSAAVKAQVLKATKDPNTKVAARAQKLLKMWGHKTP